MATDIKIEEVVHSEFRIRVLEKLVAHLINNNETLKAPTDEDMEIMRERAIQELNAKYPKTGIRLTD